MDEFLLEETVGFQSKKAVIMVGRFQPPHAGHYKVIDNMKLFLRKNKDYSVTPIVVVINGTKTSADKSKNPLTPEERIKFMQASGKANGVNFLISDSAFAAFEDVRKAGFEPIVIAAGSDRANKYVELLDKYFKNGDQSIDHFALPGLERTDADDNELKSNDVDVSKVSGSMARAAVEAGYEDVFANIVGLSNKPKLAKLLFNKIKTSMQG